MAELSRFQRELFQFLIYVIKRNGLIELRLFKENTTYTGYFNSPETAYKALQPVSRRIPDKIPFGDYPRDQEARAVYFTLNPMRPDLQAVSSNKITWAKKGQTTSDADVTAIRTVLIDADPIRNPTEISSTREEKAAAAGVIRRVKRFLKKQGIHSIPADSGNGFHLIIPVNYVDVTDAHKKTISLLSYLKENFSTEKVSIDSTVSNPSRIDKLYGTYVKKGDEIATRPHRRSAIHMRKWMFELPDQDLFEKTASIIDYNKAVSIDKKSGDKKNESDSDTVPSEIKKREFHIENLREILNKKGLTFREKEKGDRYVFEFEDCPVHQDSDGDHYECCLMVEADGMYSAKCQHDAEKGWKDFKEAIDFDANKIQIDPDIEIILGSGEEVEKKLEERKVVAIGYYRTSLMWFCDDSKQYIEYSASEINIPMLCSDWNWWQAYCPTAFAWSKKQKKFVLTKNGGIIIKEKLIADVKATGNRIDYMEIRETGVYKDRERIIFNAGNRIFVDGQETSYLQVDSSYLYQASNPIPYYGIMATVSEFEQALRLLKQTTLDGPVDAMLLLSSILAGVLSGMSPWRAHIWGCGQKGSGKSDLITLVIDYFVKAIGGIRKEGNLSEAGIRQSIGKRATIFLHDEAENNEHIINELALIRTASHGGEIVKGTPNGRSIIFKAVSTFILFSISDSIEKEADRERFIPITLKHTEGSAENWAELKIKLQEFFTEKMAAKFVYRMVCMAGYYTDLYNRVRTLYIDYVVATRKSVTNNLSRYADLYSTPITAFLLMTHDDVTEITDEFITIALKALDKTGRMDGASKESADDEGNMSVSLFNQMLDTVISVTDQLGHTIKTRIRDVLNDATDVEKKCLHQYGIYYIEKRGVIKLKNNNRYLTNIFKELGYSNYKKVLMGVPGADAGKDVFVNGEHFRGIELPHRCLSLTVTAGTASGPSIQQPTFNVVSEDLPTTTETSSDDITDILGI